MQVLTRTVILAVCLLGVFALPNNDHHGNPTGSDKVYQLLLSQVRSAFIDTRAMSLGETACANYYNNQTQSINTLLANQTNRCFEKATNTKSANNLYANQTVALMRLNMRTVEQRLHNCSALTELPQFLNCTIATYDNNLLMLDSLNAQAFQVQAEIAANQSQIDTLRQACINSAIGSAKANLTIATNDYNICLQRVPNQRNYQPMNLLN